MKIDKSVPLPSRGYDLPFEQMEIGDSFLVQGISHGYARILMHKAQKELSRKFSIRRTDEGYRCWRVK